MKTKLLIKTKLILEELWGIMEDLSLETIIIVLLSKSL
jgi:hypothetical protein